MFNFRTYYFSLSMSERAKIKDQLIKDADISETTFYRIVNGSVHIKKPLKTIINNVTKTKIYDI